eukprot:CAMPEP_0169116352 /NCGR_PEP_ID=MMETSP1015-20121227/29845_1 /TAXON_ID=342587 /ORGANISM="Karlodinium micrum, Strain CCMP2283" /LENGTH=89 /DNA_ID=CAMNT_0009178895 /DNA_START=131 /DNA_END=400 /DNA_ORIENTATION=-
MRIDTLKGREASRIDAWARPGHIDLDGQVNLPACVQDCVSDPPPMHIEGHSVVALSAEGGAIVNGANDGVGRLLVEEQCKSFSEPLACN